jgi:hypothetical protein
MTLCLVNSLIVAKGEKAATTPLTESIEQVGWCKKTAMVLVKDVPDHKSLTSK